MFTATPKRRRTVQSYCVPGRPQRSRGRRPLMEALEARFLLTGTWTPLTNPPPGSNVFDLLSDGTVITPRGAAGGGSYRLSPDVTGSYLNGTWSSAAGMIAGRQFSSQHILPDGRLLVLGGATNGVLFNTGEIYSPLTNTFSTIANFPETIFGNGPTALLADGRLLAGSINGPETYIYDPATNAWSAGPTKLWGDSSFNESWTKLPDGSILSVNVNSNPGQAQRFDQATMTWIDSGTLPVSLISGVGIGRHLGPGVLMADGRVLQLGRSSNTAIYTPSATPGGTGTWAAGPVIPNGLEAGGSDPPAHSANNDMFGSSTAALLPNGKVLFVAEMPAVGGPTRFFEFDPTAPLASSLTDVSPPISAYDTVSYAFSTRMVVLPTGQLLLGINAQIHPLHVYTPDGAPQAAWRPTITSIIANGSDYTLTGTQLNGLSAGAYYGGGTESATNYPIVQLTNSDGNVFYARSFNWSSTGVATGSLPVTTEFSLPSSIPLNNYSLRVIANGIASDPVSFTGGTPNANDMYVWDITTETQKKGNKNDARISLVIRRDSNINGASGSNDALVNNANVTVQLRNSSGSLLATVSGTTNNQGKFTSSWISNLAVGTYVVEVTALSRSGYAWNKFLDPTPNDTDLDADNLPDQQFTVGSAGAAAKSAGTSAPAAGGTSAAIAATDPGTTVNRPTRLTATQVDRVLVEPLAGRSRRASTAGVARPRLSTLDGLFAENQLG